MSLFVVIGRPCAGKSTLVDEQREPGDIVVDSDALAVACGAPAGHDAVGGVLVVALAARKAAVTAALERSRHHGERVWIVKTQLSVSDVERFQRYGAQVTVLDPGPEVCHERARAAGRHESVHAVIDAWVPVLGQGPMLQPLPPVRPFVPPEFSVPPSREW